MKSRYTIKAMEAAPGNCRQTCSACADVPGISSEEKQSIVDHAGQLYAKEAEDYFFYFLPSNKIPSPPFTFFG